MAKGAATMEREGTEGADPVEGQVEGAEPEAEKHRAKTTYFDPATAEALDTLPESPKRTGGGRSKVYAALLAKIADQGVDGKWRPIAKFGTGAGARTVANSLNRQVEGKIGTEKGMVRPEALREIPEYEGFKWEFDSRRVNAEHGQESILYARLVEAQ